MIEIKNYKDLKNFLNSVIKTSKVVLFNFGSLQNVDKVIEEILKILVEELKMSGIYFSLRNPANHTIDLLRKSKINVEKILFVDTISKYFYSPAPGVSLTYVERITAYKEGNIIFLKSPSNLSEIAIVLYELLASVKEPEKTFIIIDSLDIIALHSEREKFLKFVHFISSKFKLFRVFGFYFQLTTREEELIREISVFVDEVVEINLKWNNIMEFVTIFLILTSIFSFSLGSIIVSVIFILSLKNFASERLKKILIFQVMSLILFATYFILQILGIIFSEIEKNYLFVFSHSIILIFAVSSLIYTSLLLYILSLEIGFESPKNKEKVRKVFRS